MPVLAFFWAAGSAQAANDLVKGSGGGIYYLDGAGARHGFPSAQVFGTWYSSFQGVRTITDAALAAYPVGADVTYKPDAWLVKLADGSKVYAVAPEASCAGSRRKTSPRPSTATAGSTRSTCCPKMS